MKIAYVTNKYFHDCKMDHGRILLAQAVGRQPGVELRFTGPGWPDYGPAELLQGNLKRQGIPDLIWVYDPPKRIENRWECSIRGLAECTVPAITFHYDAYADDKFLAEITAVGSRLIVFAQESDHRYWGSRLKDNISITRIPNAASRDVFYGEGHWERPVDCLLTGAGHPEVYPLRARFRQLIEDGFIPGEVRRYPGHRLKNIEETRRQMRQYAADLRQAKIALLDASKYGLLLQKYVEAAAAGCVMVGEMPNDALFRQTLGKHLIRVDAQTQGAAVQQIITGLLRDPAGLRARSEATRQTYLDGWTTDHFAVAFVAAAGAILPLNPS